MSSYLTHMAIGAAGGVTLAHLAPGLVPVPAPLTAPALAAASAVAATWPDIDIAGSWASRRALPTLAALGALVGLVAAPAAGLAELVALASLGGLVGAVGGAALLWGIRAVSGGHRAGTHSLVALSLLVCAWGLASEALGAWALLPALLAWGLVLHILGDVVTPAGWRPLAPLCDDVVRLPRWAARHGERVVCWLAMSIIAAALGLWWPLAAVAGVPAAIVVTGGRAEGRRPWRASR